MAKKKTNQTVQAPSKTYTKCPACKSKNLIHLEVDVICGDCDWMSAEAFVDCGGMDNIYAAFNAHFPNANHDFVEQIENKEPTLKVIHEDICA